MRQKNRPLIKEEKSAHPITIIVGVQITWERWRMPHGNG